VSGGWKTGKQTGLWDLHEETALQTRVPEVPVSISAEPPAVLREDYEDFSVSRFELNEH
jgi:hypothetical protein